MGDCSKALILSFELPPISSTCSGSDAIREMPKFTDPLADAIE